jgi:NitT/TauT family transport system permease protein
VSSSPALLRWSLRLCSFAAFALIWQVAASRIHSLLFPSFTETVASLARLVATRQLWEALWVSHQAMLLGFAAAVAIGIATGLIMGRWPAADAFVDPYLTILLATPMSAVIPVVIITFGIGLFSRAAVVLLFSVVVIAVNTRAGLRTLDPAWLEMARSFGATERQLWRTVIVPGALPAILTGLQLGVGRALTGMVAVELLLVAVGIGRLISDFQGMFDAGAIYATVAVVVAEAVILLNALRWLERRFAPWAAQIAVE